MYISDVGVIVANVDDIDSIEKMCVNAKLLINCVGPVGLLISLKFLFLSVNYYLCIYMSNVSMITKYPSKVKIEAN